ncbi:GroES-like protein [Aulographum hederae CBS 113979]|uniref:GroES-like protein n=1 Tax=Aulographum hederae CBS 113979 TaxID=1176131 RepID=A0A6G1GLJ6_9PEZI|nr:GroES-like protein [Aulographum hederae CBS 113979]
MRAARYYGKEDIRIEQIEEPKCGKGQIKIKPAFVGICGTDLHEYLGGPTFAPTSPHPITKETIPITLGHEFSGTISELGEGVSSSNFKVGQKVAVQPTLCCMTCNACKRGAENVCTGGGFVGLSGGGGGLSDAVCVSQDFVVPLPESVGLDIAALVEPLSVAWHAISAAPVEKDDTVLILGGGPIGLAIVQCLRAKKVKTIIVSEIAEARQRFAKDFGAHHVLHSINDKVVEKSAEISGKDGVDVVFDCAGVPASLTTACQAVKAKGYVVNVAIWEKPIPFQPNMLGFREAQYRPVLGYQRKDFEAVIECLASGAMKPEPMITRRIRLEDLVDQGIKNLITNKDKEVKILVDIAS